MISETLKKAREIMTQFDLSHGRYARDAYGNGLIDTQSDEVCALCSVGAVARALGIESMGAAHCRAVEYLAKALGNDDPWNHSVAVFQFNDKSTKDEVLAMFDKAIKLAEEDERGN